MSTPGTILLTSAGRVMVRSGKPLAVGPTEAKDCCCTDPCCTGSFVGYFTGKNQVFSTIMSLQLQHSGFVGYTSGGNSGAPPDIEFYGESEFELSRTSPNCNSVTLSLTRRQNETTPDQAPSWSASASSPSGLSEVASSESLSPPVALVGGGSGGAAGVRIGSLDTMAYSSYLGTSPGSAPVPYSNVLYTESGYDSSKRILSVGFQIGLNLFYDDGAGSTAITFLGGDVSYAITMDTLGRVQLSSSASVSANVSGETYSAAASPTYDGAAVVGCTLSFSAGFTSIFFPRETHLIDGTAVIASNMKGCPA